MPINYELEKEIFFKTYGFKLGDKIVIPTRSNNCVATITEICPKFIKLTSDNVDYKGKKIKVREWYSQNNKMKEHEKPYLYFTPLEELPCPHPDLLN